MPADTLPFAPGESPFHAKGTVWIGIRNFVEQHAPGGVAAVGRELADPRSRTFFEGMFLPSGWYDILPIIEVSNAIATVMGIGLQEYVRRSAMWHADQDLKGVYKILGKLPSPEALCRRFASMSTQMWNFVQIEIVREEKNRVDTLATGLPQVLVPWWLRATECYTNAVLKAIGAKNGRVLWQKPLPDGTAHGIAIVRVPAVTTWDL